LLPQSPSIEPVQSAAVLPARIARLAGALGAVLVVALLVASVAGAATGHRYAGQFSAAGSAPGDLDGPSGLAVLQPSGEVYVLDQGWSTGVPRVQGFSAAGVFMDQRTGADTPAGGFSAPSGVAVEQPSGDGSSWKGYVADTGNNVVVRFDASGEFDCVVNDPGPAGCSATVTDGFSSPSGVAVDPDNGDVYVSDTGNNVVKVFDSTGAYLGAFDGSDNSAADGPFSGPTSIAVDSAHNVYVLDSGKGRVEKYAGGLLGAATFVSNLAVANPVAVAVNPLNLDVFVGANGPSGPEIVHVDPAGDPVSTFGAGRIGGIGGLGAHVSGRVEVADNVNGNVLRFAPFTAPDVTTTAPIGVSATGATFEGHVDPAGGSDVTDCHFDYVDQATYETSGYSSPNQVGCDQPAPFSAPTDVTATVGGLAPNTTYHLRLVATNASGSSTSTDRTFTTDAAPPTVDAGGPFASDISTAAATLNATVNPNGSETTYRFEYGTDTSYGQTTPDASVGSTPGDQSVSADIDGLSPGTVYHFRVVADNGTGGEIVGADATFATAPAAPAGATDVTGVAATLTGAIDPQGSSATYRFEYGTSTAYGKSTPEADGGSGTGAQTVTAPVSGLQPDTTYHVRVVATVNGQTVTGADGTFTTAPAPTVAIGAATDVTSSAATLHATTDTNGLPATYTFTVTATDSPYASTTAPAPVPAGGAISARVEGLPADGEFTFKAHVTAAGATSHSQPAAFATLPLSGSGPPPRVPDVEAPYPPPKTTARLVNRFTLASSTVRGASRRARLVLRLPRAGVVTIRHRYLKTLRRSFEAGGTVRLVVGLNRRGLRALRKTRGSRRSIAYVIRYTPEGGASTTRRDTLTFKRKATK
jgi:NHL repeat